MSLQNFWRAMVELQEKVAQMEARIDAIESARKPGRPKKMTPDEIVTATLMAEDNNFATRNV